MGQLEIFGQCILLEFKKIFKKQ